PKLLGGICGSHAHILPHSHTYSQATIYSFPKRTPRIFSHRKGKAEMQRRRGCEASARLSLKWGYRLLNAWSTHAMSSAVAFQRNMAIYPFGGVGPTSAHRGFLAEQYEATRGRRRIRAWVRPLPFARRASAIRTLFLMRRSPVLSTPYQPGEDE